MRMWFQAIFKTNNKIKEKVNHHFILIEEVPLDVVGQEIILWGEASWWPKKSLMKFTRLTKGEISVGTRYDQKVLLPFAPKWNVEITKIIPGREIERTFLNGMFQGKESVQLEERYNGIKVSYSMHYQIQGWFNNMMWHLVFQKLHDKNINMILSALQDYILAKQREGQE